MKFNERLIELRKKQGLSQEEMGYKLNVTRQTISKWELGQTTPEMDKLVEISKIFNVKIDELIKETNEEIVDERKEDVIKEKVIENDYDFNIDDGKKANKKRSTIIIVIIIIILIMAVIFGINSTKRIKDKKNNNKEIVNSTFKESNSIMDKLNRLFSIIFDKFESIEEESILNMEEIEFDKNFKNYIGEKNGIILKKVIDNIITNNNKKKKDISIVYDKKELKNNEEIMNFKNTILDDKIYDLQYEYDNEGNINKLIITKKISQAEIILFNAGIELYGGINSGNQVKLLLDNVIRKNAKNDRKIIVKYEDKESNDNSEIRKITHKLETFEEYEIIHEYDKDGFIYKITIEKI